MGVFTGSGIRGERERQPLLGTGTGGMRCANPDPTPSPATLGAVQMGLGASSPARGGDGLRGGRSETPGRAVRAEQEEDAYDDTYDEEEDYP